MGENHRLLLGRAVLLYEKHEAGRPKPFNVFSVLRSERDEVNLHSRFLHALLNYTKPNHETKENLQDFLRHVGVSHMDLGRLKDVEREKGNIDILITDRDWRCAVAIENKIDADDQPEQLCRYYNALKEQGYRKVRVLYLTLEGHEPSDHSFCSCECDARSNCETISYRETLPDWLERCQKHAYDEPELRESIAQYRHLIRKLCGQEFGEVYMNELKGLLLEGGNGENLLAAYDLASALTEAKVDLLMELWCEVDAAMCAMRTEISDLPHRDDNFEPWTVSEDFARRLFTGTKNPFHHLFYPFRQEAAISVEAGTGQGLVFGVYCDKAKYLQLYEQLCDALRAIPGVMTNRYWPGYLEAAGCLKLRYAVHDDLQRLAKKDFRKEYAQGIAQGLMPFWDAVKQVCLNGPG